MIDIYERIAVGEKNECWKWYGAKDTWGYAMARVDGKTRRVSRIIYRLVKGDIGEGLEIMHTCGNPGCVNPYHMKATTHGELTLRGNGASGINSRKTHCINGHLLPEPKMYGGIMRRMCQECRREYQRQRYHENKGLK